MLVQASRLTPELVEWWLRLRELPKHLQGVHRWLAAEHPPTDAGHHHLHVIPTLVICLSGGVRVSDGKQRIDLKANEGLVIQPGAWHVHEPIRRGTLVFQQGFLRGRSDFWFATHEVQLIASVPQEPSRTLLERAAQSGQAEERRRCLAELISALVRESIEPLRPLHPAVAHMDAMLWRLVGEPGNADDIIRVAGIGRAQAYRLFTEQHGGPPAAVLLEQRLILAEYLLSAGVAVADVATRCGFPSRQTFSRAFRRSRGRPPGRPGRRAG